MKPDARLRGAIIEAAPKLAAAYCHGNREGFEREMRRLNNQCGYIMTRRSLDAALHCPEALAHAIASAAPRFRNATTKAERTAAALHFCETLLGQGVKAAADQQLRRLPISDAMREAFVSAAPGALLAAAKQDARGGAHVATELVRDVVQAKAIENLSSGTAFKDQMKNAALMSAPTIAVAGIRNTKDSAVKAVLEFVGRAGVVTVDHIADKFIRTNAEDLFAAKRSATGFVKEMVMHDWLQKREFVLPAARSLPGMMSAAQIPAPHLAVAAGLIAARPIFAQAWTHVVYTTPRAAQQWAVPLPPDLRQAFIPHYLRTMDACLSIERRFEAEGKSVIRIAGENQLIRENFQGQVFKKGRVMPKFPDAQLTVRNADGSVQVVNVEYVTKSYTPQMIQAKAAAFTGPTVWAVDSYATGAKVLANAGADADLLIV